MFTKVDPKLTVFLLRQHIRTKIGKNVGHIVGNNPLYLSWFNSYLLLKAYLSAVCGYAVWIKPLKISPNKKGQLIAKKTDFAQPLLRKCYAVQLNFPNIGINNGKKAHKTRYRNELGCIITYWRVNHLLDVLRETSSIAVLRNYKLLFRLFDLEPKVIIVHAMMWKIEL